MLDRLVLHIPIDASLVDISSDGKHCILGFELLDLGLGRVGSWDVYKNCDGEIRHSALNHGYERLPSSYTKMAFKFFHEGTSFPFVELKASPAKILQGHNVYGTDCIQEGALEMLGILSQAHPTLYGMLAVSETEVKSFDVTYSARLRNEEQVKQVIAYMRNFSSKHIRKSPKKIEYKNTLYFGSERAKRYARKMYGKYQEFMEQLEEQKKLAKANDKNAQRVVEVMSCPKLQQYATGLLRFETGVKAYAMKEQGIPTNLFQLIRYQRKNPDFLKKVWIKANEEIFKAFEGQTMRTTDHDAVYEALLKVFTKTTPTGRISTTKARNLFQFYIGLEMFGCDAMKKKYCESQYYQHFSDLVNSGLFSKAYLQNLQQTAQNNVVPFLKIIEVDFNAQLPVDFVEPKSQFSRVA